MMKTYKLENENGFLFEIPESANVSDFSIGASFQPYCIWLYGTRMCLPIGNAVYPFRHDQLEIVGTSDTLNKEQYQIPETGR